MQVAVDGSPPAGRTKRVSFKDKSPAERALLVKARNRKAQQVSMDMGMIVADPSVKSEHDLNPKL